MKKILVICGHPSPTSLNHELTLSYLKGANESGFAVKELFISDLVFNPNLASGYEKKTELEPDLQKLKNIFLGQTIWYSFILCGGAAYPHYSKDF